MEQPQMLYEKAGHIAVVTINRSESKNAGAVHGKEGPP